MDVLRDVCLLDFVCLVEVQELDQASHLLLRSLRVQCRMEVLDGGFVL